VPLQLCTFSSCNSYSHLSAKKKALDSTRLHEIWSISLQELVRTSTLSHSNPCEAEFWNSCMLSYQQAFYFLHIHELHKNNLFRCNTLNLLRKSHRTIRNSFSFILFILTASFSTQVYIQLQAIYFILYWDLLHHNFKAYLDNFDSVFQRNFEIKGCFIDCTRVYVYIYSRLFITTTQGLNKFAYSVFARHAEMEKVFSWDTRRTSSLHLF